MLRLRRVSNLVIRGGRVIDPWAGRDEVADVVVIDGVIVAPPSGVAGTGRDARATAGGDARATAAPTGRDARATAGGDARATAAPTGGDARATAGGDARATAGGDARATAAPTGGDARSTAAPTGGDARATAGEGARATGADGGGTSGGEGVEVIDARGRIVCPGLMDIHVHLREPGGEHKETIETGTAAAARGGFTFVACMPNTRPPIDTPRVVRQVLDAAAQSSWCGVGPIGCVTVGRAGAALADVDALFEAGAVAISDDGDGVENDDVMRAALQAARRRGGVVIQHCEYKSISAGGVMHLGEVSRRVGVPGLDPQSEEAMIERDIALCRETGGRYHVAHISTARAIELVRRAKAEGLPVTCEVCTHHLMLTDDACADLDPNTKMHPPLRPQDDVDACRAGLLDGTIDCIVTDHAPHAAAEKARGFLEAPPGIVGVETALGLAAKAMVESDLADWRRIVEWFTTGPARVLGRPAPSLEPGSPANLTIIDPDAPWTVDPTTLISKSRNTPFGGWTLPCRATATVRGDRLLTIGDAPAPK